MQSKKRVVCRVPALEGLCADAALMHAVLSQQVTAQLDARPLLDLVRQFLDLRFVLLGQMTGELEHLN